MNTPLTPTTPIEASKLEVATSLAEVDLLGLRRNTSPEFVLVPRDVFALRAASRTTNLIINGSSSGLVSQPLLTIAGVAAGTYLIDLTLTIPASTLADLDISGLVFPAGVTFPLGRCLMAAGEDTQVYFDPVSDPVGLTGDFFTWLDGKGIFPVTTVNYRGLVVVASAVDFVVGTPASSNTNSGSITFGPAHVTLQRVN